MFGDYPNHMRQILGPNLPRFTEGEKKLLRNHIDFIGVNHYKTLYVKDCIYSLCDLDTYIGDALVSESAERDGVPIGKPVKSGTVHCIILMQQESHLQIDLAQPNTAKLILQTPIANNYVVPSSMEKLVMYLKQRYRSVPLYITENGGLLCLAKSRY